MSKVLDRIAVSLQPYVKECIEEACTKAYAAGYEDATRRAHELYNFGIYAGLTLATETEGIEELDPDLFDELDPDVFDEEEDNND